MAVTTENNRTDELITDGVVEEFDFSMLIFDKSEVEVYYKPDDGRYNSLLLDTNYGVTFTEDGGTVSTNGYSAPLAAGKLLIIRHLELTQQTNWLYNDNHTEQTHQDDFDRAVMRDLQIQGELNRCPKFPIHSSTKDITFPEPQVGYLIGWNSAGDNLTNISPPAAAGAITAILNDLDDVIIAAPINGDLLRYNGTEWTNDLAGAVTYTSITIAGNTLDTNEWSNLDGVDQSLASGDAVVFDDITISTPVNIYALSHDLFADYVAAEHINWTADQGATNIDAANLAGSPTFTEITIFGNTNLYRLYLAAEFESPDSVKEMLRLTRTEDDIALDGLGLSQEYYLEDAGGVTRHAARMIVDWTDIDSRISSIKFYTREGDSVDLRMTISDEIVIPGGVNVTGRIVANSYISGDSLITGGDVGIVADADLLQLAANALTVNGTLGAGAITGTSFIIGDNTLDTNEWAFLDGLDQSVKSGTAPTFTADNFSDGGSNAIITTTQETNFETAYGWGDHASGGYAVSGGAEHDGFSDFVADEHIDWTGASAGTIDATNIEDKFLRNDGADSTSGALTAAGFITIGTTNTYILEIPATTDTPAGLITQAGGRFIHSYGTENIFIGLNSGNFTLTGTGGNIGLGAETLSNLTDGIQNVAIGRDALTAATSGGMNMAIGMETLKALTSGHSNVAIGRSAGYRITDGEHNVMIGRNSIIDNLHGDRNVAIGSYSLQNNLQSENVAIGHYTGSANINGSGNVFIGCRAGYYELGSDKLFIDNAARASEADARIKALIYGTFAAAPADQTLRINAGVIMMTDIPAANPEIVGQLWNDGGTMKVSAG